MNDKDLYELCVSSGFTESEWWPKDSGIRSHWTLVFREEAWEWVQNMQCCDCSDADARARILAGLVEWATTDLRILNAGFARCSVSHKENVQHFGVGEPIVALLDCFSQWRAAQ